MPEMLEANKDAGRNTIFSMVSVVVTYFVNRVLPQDIPLEVRPRYSRTSACRSNVCNYVGGFIYPQK